MISWRRLWTLVAIVFLSSLATRSAFAANNDAQAAKLREAAIYQDYLATDFASAEKKLTQALALCDKPADCTAATRARLHCDLGVVNFASQKTDAAHAQFAAALKEDPNVTIDADLTTPELQKEFATVKGGGKPAAGPAAADAGTPPAAEGENGEEEETETPAPKPPKPAAGDCPPGMPGCAAEAASCNSDDECAAGEKCVDSKCSSGEVEGAPGKVNWISVAFQGDLLLLPGGADLCQGGKGYSCFNAGTSTWYGKYPSTTGPNGTDSTPGGLSLATLRIMAGYDRRFGNITAGGALGFAFGGGPQRPAAGGQPAGAAFLPFHGEIRGRYWFGHNPLRKGFWMYGGLVAGIAEVDSKITVHVDSGQAVDAWHKTGTGFGGIGIGGMGVVSSSFGIGFELRGVELFPTTGTAISLQVSAAYGL